MTIVRNTFDKRIKDFCDILSFKKYDDKYVGKAGYFSDSMCRFQDLTTCVKGTLTGIDKDVGAGDYIFETEYGNYRYFIPESLVKPVKKKYRALTLNEFLERFKIGEAIYIRFKRDGAERVVVFTEYNIPPHKDEGNDTESVCLTGMEHHKSVVCLGMREYYLATLFDCYEYFDGKEWQPFGVIDE